jgi:hypothetical protein
MTGFAFVFFYFIPDKSKGTLLLRFMTFCARHINMFPIEFEIRFAVVELRGFPVVGSMASLAIGLPAHFKLTVMPVGMAGGAIFG